MWQHIFAVIFILLGVILSVLFKKLDLIAAITGGFIASAIYLGSGLLGTLLLSVFFLIGTLATSWKVDQKEQLCTDDKNNGRRTAGQVFANAGIAGLLGFLT